MVSATLKPLEDFFAEYASKCDEYEKASRIKADLYNELDLMEKKAIEFLTQEGKEDYHSNAGTFSYKWEEVYLMPKGEHNRNKFFAYLKDQKIFEQMTTVNAATLNSWAKKESEGHDLNWEIPGIEKGTPRARVSFRRKK